MKIDFFITVTLVASLAILPAPHLSDAVMTEDSTTAVGRPGVNLKLVGTAVASESEKSMAVIVIDGRYQVYLREGDVVDNVLIKRILYDRVIVDAGDGEESVKLRQLLSAGTKILNESVQSSTPPKTFGSPPPEGRNFQVVYLDRETAETVFANIDAELSDVRIDPISVYGESVGFRIFPVAQGSVFAEIGLKTGDVVREVNGEAVFSPEEAVALIHKFKGGGEFDIKVKGRRSRHIHLIVE